jgi:hypothetical protein
MLDGALTHVSLVPSGLSCGCRCPACDAPLVAKKGTKKLHHFAHAKDADCASSVETALHLAAKEILDQRKQIALPAVEAKLYSTRHSAVLAPEQTYALDSVQLERRVGSVIPDVLAYVRGRAIAIEIRVTHAVDPTKAAHFRKIGLSAVEIDLSRAPRTFTLEELEPLVVGAGKHKSWVFNAAAHRRREEVLSTGKVMRSVSRGFATHVDDCPIQARVWKGRSYANVVDDCIGCEHALEIGPNMNSVICGGTPPTHQGKLFRSDA